MRAYSGICDSSKPIPISPTYYAKNEQFTSNPEATFPLGSAINLLDKKSCG